jgi:hypothetical protein
MFNFQLSDGIAYVRLRNDHEGTRRHTVNFHAVSACLPSRDVLSFILKIWHSLEHNRINVTRAILKRHKRNARAELEQILQGLQRGESLYSFSSQTSAVSVFLMAICTQWGLWWDGPVEDSQWTHGDIWKHLPNMDHDAAVYELVTLSLGLDIDLCRQAGLTLMTQTGEPPLLGLTREPISTLDGEIPQSMTVWLGINSGESIFTGGMEAWKVSDEAGQIPKWQVRGVWIPFKEFEERPNGGYLDHTARDAILI